MILLATSNLNKIKEYKDIYPYFEFKLADKNIKVTEDGATFKENSLIKAIEYFKEYKCNVMSDDSGLEINKLNDFPGIYSSRFANSIKDNKIKNQLILDRMKDISDRSARFVCVITLIDYRGIKYYGEGILEGSISYEIKGENGFGYDSIFIPKGYDKTLGELEENIKNSISHRCKAFNDLLSKLPVKFLRREKHD